MEFILIFYTNVAEPIINAFYNLGFFGSIADTIGDLLYFIYSSFTKQPLLSRGEYIDEFYIFNSVENIYLFLGEITAIIVMIIVIKWVLRMITSPFKYMSNGGGINDEKITYESKRKGKKTKRK